MSNTRVPNPLLHQVYLLVHALVRLYSGCLTHSRQQESQQKRQVRSFTGTEGRRVEERDLTQLLPQLRLQD